MNIEWRSLDGQKRQWFNGMVETTFSVGPDQTVSVICDKSVTNDALLVVATAALKNLVENLEFLESKLKEKNGG